MTTIYADGRRIVTNGNDPIMRAAGVQVEVTVRSDGIVGPFGRPVGSQVLDLQLIKDRTLYYVDGKTGSADIKNAYLKGLANKLGPGGSDAVDKIIGITVK